jgi:hypothetical protein
MAKLFEKIMIATDGSENNKVAMEKGLTDLPIIIGEK